MPKYSVSLLTYDKSINGEYSFDDVELAICKIVNNINPFADKFKLLVELANTGSVILSDSGEYGRITKLIK